VGGRRGTKGGGGGGGGDAGGLTIPTLFEKLTRARKRQATGGAARKSNNKIVGGTRGAPKKQL